MNANGDIGGFCLMSDEASRTYCTENAPRQAQLKEYLEHLHESIPVWTVFDNDPNAESGLSE